MPVTVADRRVAAAVVVFPHLLVSPSGVRGAPGLLQLDAAVHGGLLVDGVVDVTEAAEPARIHAVQHVAELWTAEQDGAVENRPETVHYKYNIAKMSLELIFYVQQDINAKYSAYCNSIHLIQQPTRSSTSVMH